MTEELGGYGEDGDPRVRELGERVARAAAALDEAYEAACAEVGEPPGTAGPEEWEAVGEAVSARPAVVAALRESEEAFAAAREARRSGASPRARFRRWADVAYARVREAWGAEAEFLALPGWREVVARTAAAVRAIDASPDDESLVGPAVAAVLEVAERTRAAGREVPDLGRPEGPPA